MRSSVVIALLVAAAIAVGASAASLPGVQTSCTPSSARVKPRKIVIACGDGNFYVTSLRWSSWSSTSARGKGTAHLNDCRPACFDGHFHSYRGLTVRLSKPRTCKGRKEFSRLTYRFGTSHPKGIMLSGSQKFLCP